MARAWVYQDPHQIQKRGEGAASWYVGWFDPAGKKRCKSCGPGALGRKNADRLRAKVEAELIEGTYRRESDRKQWEEFRKEYDKKIVEGMIPSSQRVIRDALNAFEKAVKPVRMAGVRTQTIDEFRSRRRQARGKKPGSKMSPASINKELRHLKAALEKAQRWGYLAQVPEFTFEREPGKLIRFVTGEHFAAIYPACDHAREPKGHPFEPGDWWRGILCMAYMTGWRISELLALRRGDLDLVAGTAITRAADNKGKRTELLKLHPVVVEHLARLASFSPTVFPWAKSEKALYEAFHRIQDKAGIYLLCSEDHKHTRCCHVYGFHDLRRAYATVNAERLTPDQLQKMMRHRSYLTTQKYINMAKQLDQAVEVLHVPPVLRPGVVG